MEAVGVDYACETLQNQSQNLNICDREGFVVFCLQRLTNASLTMVGANITAFLIRNLTTVRVTISTRKTWSTGSCATVSHVLHFMYVSSSPRASDSF